MRLLLARHPDRSDANYALTIEEFTSLNLTGKAAAATEMIGMLRDLHANGRASRYLRNLTGTPLMELKPTTRRGQQLKVALTVYLAHQRGVSVLSAGPHDGNLR